MNELLKIIQAYRRDIEGLDDETFKDVIEALDAFLNDLKISQWDVEAVGYGK
jgi:hypothetical protein